MEFFIIWAFFGILTGVVAAAKGRNAFVWFALGVVGGIFALTYVAFARRIDPPVAPSEPWRYGDVSTSGSERRR